MATKEGSELIVLARLGDDMFSEAVAPPGAGARGANDLVAVLQRHEARMGPLFLSDDAGPADAMESVRKGRGADELPPYFRVPAGDGLAAAERARAPDDAAHREPSRHPGARRVRVHGGAAALIDRRRGRARVLPQRSRTVAVRPRSRRQQHVSTAAPRRQPMRVGPSGRSSYARRRTPRAPVAVGRWYRKWTSERRTTASSVRAGQSFSPNARVPSLRM